MAVASANFAPSTAKRLVPPLCSSPNASWREATAKTRGLPGASWLVCRGPFVRLWPTCLPKWRRLSTNVPSSPKSQKPQKKPRHVRPVWVPRQRIKALWPSPRNRPSRRRIGRRLVEVASSKVLTQRLHFKLERALHSGNKSTHPLHGTCKKLVGKVRRMLLPCQIRHHLLAQVPSWSCFPIPLPSLPASAAPKREGHV